MMWYSNFSLLVLLGLPAIMMNCATASKVVPRHLAFPTEAKTTTTTTTTIAALPDNATYASARKDEYVDPTKYPERWGPNPIHGGRVHFVLPRLSSAEAVLPLLLEIKTDYDYIKLLMTPNQVINEVIDWARVELTNNTAWLSFHTQRDDILSCGKQILITDASKATIASVDVRQPPEMTTNYVDLTYFTSDADYTKVVLHFQNGDGSPHTISSLSINGVAQTANFTMKPYEHFVLEVPALSSLMSVWTVGIVVDDNQKLGWGGVLDREVVPFETWPKSKDCPFPSTNATNFKLNTDLGVDTFFYAPGCGNSTEIFQHARANDFWLLPSEDMTKTAGGVPSLDGVLAAFLADEIDGTANNSRKAWNNLMVRRQLYPELPTYQGSKTSKYSGIFSGITDIQGIDYYAAGCAPHITAGIAPMHLRGPLDYIKNTRRNQRPGKVWAYSQFLCTDCWDVHELHAGEITIQLASVFAAGSKGLMLFQTDVKAASFDAWTASKNILASFRQIRQEIRVGDVTQHGVSWTNDGVLSADETEVAMIQGPDFIVVLALNFAGSGYNDLTCAIDVAAHWEFRKVTIKQISLPRPTSFDVGSIVEYVNGAAVSDPVPISTADNNINMGPVELGTEVTARIFLIKKKVT